MGTRTLYKCFFSGGFFLATTLTGCAKDNKPYPHNAAFASMAMRSVSDTIPPQENKRTEENAGTKPEEVTKEVIKEVPKSRKQIKPLAVTSAVPIKPVVVKPKIIVKPIIKLQ